MSEDLINRYKKSSRISFQNASSETKFRELQQRSGPDSSVLAFTVLFLLCLAYAYLEFRAFGHDIPIPMYGYLLAAGMALVSPDGRFLEVNPAFCEFLGYSKEELLDLDVKRITHPEHQERSRDAFGEL